MSGLYTLRSFAFAPGSGTLSGRETNVCSRTSHCHDANKTERDCRSISEDESCWLCYFGMFAIADVTTVVVWKIQLLQQDTASVAYAVVSSLSICHKTD